MRIIFTLLLLTALPLSSMSQSSNLGNWLIYIGNKDIKERFNWHNEVQYRAYNAISDLEQLLIRTGIGYNLTENNNNLLLGYGFIHSQNYIEGTNDKFNVNEHRIYQQFITRQSFGRSSLQHRYRFEQRWVESDFKLRFRYFLMLNVVLNKKEMSQGALYFSAYNEIFLNSAGNIFDRNRLYGGLGYKISRATRFELGYMNQFFEKGGRDQINIIALVNF